MILPGIIGGYEQEKIVVRDEPDKSPKILFLGRRFNGVTSFLGRLILDKPAENSPILLAFINILMKFSLRAANFSLEHVSAMTIRRNHLVNALYVSRGCWNNCCVNDRDFRLRVEHRSKTD